MFNDLVPYGPVLGNSHKHATRSTQLIRDNEKKKKNSSAAPCLHPRQRQRRARARYIPTDPSRYKRPGRRRGRAPAEKTTKARRPPRRRTETRSARPGCLDDNASRDRWRAAVRPAARAAVRARRARSRVGRRLGFRGGARRVGCGSVGSEGGRDSTPGCVRGGWLGERESRIGTTIGALDAMGKF